MHLISTPPNYSRLNENTVYLGMLVLPFQSSPADEIFFIASAYKLVLTYTFSPTLWQIYPQILYTHKIYLFDSED